MRTTRQHRWLGLVLVGAVALSAAETTGQQQRFGVSSVGIVLDATVRDASGAPLACLEASQFEIVEDNVPQQLLSFDAVGMSRCGTETQPQPTREPSVREAVATPPTVTALVFEELGPDARAAAWRAATALVEEREFRDEFIGVFSVDRAVHTHVAYTKDKAAVMAALREAAMRPGCPVAVEATTSAAADASGCHRAPRIDTIRAFERVASSLAALPGRKNLLLFSEGFTVQTDSNEFDAFERLIAQANQNTVTVHSVDAAGLRVLSPRVAAQAALRDYTGGIGPDGGLKGKLDANAILAKDPTAPLARLARDTGGEVVADTNDLTGAVKRVGADMRQYYRLTYIPSNQSDSRRPRRIKVNVRVPGATVRYRSGYYESRNAVVPPQDAAPHLLLDRGPLPRDFDTMVEGVVTSGAIEVSVSVIAGGLQANVDSDRSVFESGVTILARLRSRDGRVVASASETMTLAGRVDQLASVKARALVFKKAFESNNAETLEVIAYDVLSGRASAQRLKVRELPWR